MRTPRHRFVSIWMTLALMMLSCWAPSAPCAPGDINRSGRVDGEDLIDLARRIGQPTDPNDARDFDLDKDGMVDALDQGLLQRNFGLHGAAATLWVADASGQRVRKLSPLSGRVLAEVSGFTQLSRLVVGPNNDAYVMDFGSIVVVDGGLLGAYDIDSGTGHHRTLAGFGNNSWHDVNAADGRLWVVNRSSGRLYRIEPDAPSGYNVTSATGHHAQMTVSGAGNIAVDGARGVVWVAWPTQGLILRLRSDAPDGYNPQNDSGYHTAPTASSPGLISVDPTTGRLWIVRFGNRISLLSADGLSLTEGQTGLSGLSEIAADAKNGGCWFARSSDTLGLVDSAAAHILFSTTSFTRPLRLTPMRDTGWVWLTDDDRELVLVTPRGDEVIRRAVDGQFTGAGANPLPPDARSPVVDLLVGNSEPALGGSVNFTAFVLDQREPIVSYRWDFDGDGRFDRTTSLASTSFAYDRQMLALPMVEAIDNRGFSGFSKMTAVVPGYLAAVVEATPTSGALPLMVEFTGRYFDPQGTATVLNYRYDFDGDGVDDYTSTTDSDTSFTYEAAGEFDATFKITFAGGRVSTAKVRITTSQAGPTAVAGADQTAGVRPLTVTFYSDQSSDADGRILLYAWDFNNDGTFEYAAVSSQAVPHTYTSEGDYTAVLRVTDNSGLSDTDSVSVLVGPPTPVAVAEATPTLGHAPLQVQFTGDQSHAVNGSLVAYEWLFGDGDTLLSADGFPTRQLFLGYFLATGCGDLTTLLPGVLDASPSAGDTLGGNTWQVRSDDDGLFSWYSYFGGSIRNAYSLIYLYAGRARDVQIRYRTMSATRFWINGALVHSTTYCGVLPTNEAVFDTHLDQGWNRVLASCPGEFSNWQLGYRFTDRVGRPLQALYRTNRPDGAPPTGYYGSSSTPNTVHTYPREGQYTARLVVTDSAGLSGSDSVAVEVIPATAPIAMAQATPPQGQAPLLVQLTGTGTNDPNGNITRYRWDFEGGNLTEDAEGASRVVADEPWGRSSLGVAPGHGRYAWTDSPGGNYLPNTNASLRTFPVDLSAATSGFLRFYQRYNFGAGDFGYVEGSIDGGKSWQQINAYSFTFDSWHQPNVSLNNYFGKSNVMFRFRMFSDSNPSTVGDGWYIDDIVVDVNTPPFEYQSPTTRDTSHTYELPGYYTPTLEVTDADGFVSSASAPLRVLSLPSVELIAPASGAVYRSATIEFVASGFDLDGRVVKYEWDFEADGNYDLTLLSSALITHAYPGDGPHTARLRATDDTGLSVVLETAFSIADRPLAVELTATPDSGNIPLAVQLAATYLPPDLTIVASRWDVDGDGVDDFSYQGKPGRVLDVPSSGNTTTLAASNLIDGGTGTNQGWQSGYIPQYPIDILLELHGGQVWMIDRFAVDPRVTGGNATYQPTQCQLLVSVDDIAHGFVPVQSFTLPEGSGRTEFTFAPTPARYVKLRVFSNVSLSSYLTIGELEVYASGDNVTTTVPTAISYTYAASGTFHPRVTLQDVDGMTASARTRVDALVSNRVTATLAFTPPRPRVNEDVYLSGDGTAPGSSIVRFEYDLNNDGVFELVDDTAGVLDSFTNQENTSSRKAANLIDGKNTGGFRWGSGTIATPSTEQEFVFHFAGLTTHNIDTVAVDPVSDYGVNGQVQSFTVEVSVVSATEGFAPVGMFTLEQTSAVQAFHFTSTPAKWVKLRALESYGDTRMGMAEFRVQETGLGDNLLAVDGDTVQRYSAVGSYPVTLRVVDALARSATAAVIVDVDPTTRDDIHIWTANQDASLFRTDVNGVVDVDVRGFGNTFGVAVDRQRNHVWVSDPNKDQVFVLSRDVPAADYNVTTSTGFHKVLTGFLRPSQPIIDPANGFAWIGDLDRNAIYIVDPAAPDGYNVNTPGAFHRTILGLNGPYLMDWDAGFDAVWVADYDSNYVYKIDRNAPAGYDVSSGTTAHFRYDGFNRPYSIAVDRQRDRIYITDYNGDALVQFLGTPPDRYNIGTDSGYHRIRTGIDAARGLAIDPRLGNVLVCSEFDDYILWLTPELAPITQVAGFNGPNFSIFNERTGELYLALGAARQFHRCSIGGRSMAMLGSRPNIEYMALDQPERDAGQDPQVALSAAPTVGALPHTVNFSAAASDPNGPIARYNWDVDGDGHVDETSTGSNTAQHVYREESRLFAVAEVIDSDGRTARDWQVLGSGEFRLDLAASPLSGHGALQVALTALAFSPRGIVRYLWDLDSDGLFEEETNVADNNVTLNRAGEHVLRVRAQDGGGLLQDAAARVVLVNAPPTVNFNASPSQGTRPLEVQFSGSANDSDGAVIALMADLDGDGAIDQISSTFPSTQRVFEEVGDVTATLYAVDDDGLMGSLSKVITVGPKATALIAQATSPKANVGDNVQFDALVDADGPIAQYGWDFDGNGKVDQVSAAGPAMSHIYSATGVYGAVVYATDSLGRIVTDTVVLSVRPAGTPFAVAEAVPDLVRLGFSTQLHAENSHDPGGSITHYRWYLDSELAWMDDNGVNRLISMAADGSRRVLQQAQSVTIYGLAVNPQNGDLWVSTSYNEVWRCDRHGRRLATISGLGARGMVVDATRGVVWMADYSYSRVLRLSLSVPDGYNIGASTDYHTALVGVSNPGTVALDQRDGSCWALDLGGNHRLRKISPDGTQILATVLGWDGGGDMAVDGQRGVIWLSDRGPSKLYRISPNVPDGYNVTSSTGFHASLSGLSLPEEIGVIPDSGETWVVTFGPREVVRVNAAGTGVVQRLPKFTYPIALAVLPEDGSVLVSDTQDHTIQGYTRKGDRFLSSQTVGLVSVMTAALRDHVADSNLPTPVEVAPPVQGDAAFELVVTDNSGLTDRDAASLRVPAGESPVALPAAYPTRGPAPLDVNFVANGFDPDGTLYYLRWDYQGDGINDFSNQTTASSNYTYTTPGVYDAVLTVEDIEGNLDQKSIRITVESSPLTVEARAAPEAGPAPLTVVFYAEMPQLSSVITLFEWDFDGDGTFDYSSPTSPVVRHTYLAPGVYSARLRATGTGNQQVTDTAQVTALDERFPTALAAADPVAGGAPLVVHFTGAGLDSDGSVVLYQWDFDGDGSFDYSDPAGGDTTHTYDDSGLFLARLRVTDNDGFSGEAVVGINVAAGFIAAWNVEAFDPLRGQGAELASALVSPTSMTVRILTRQGATVRTLVAAANRTAGVHIDNWDGRNSQGQIVSPGSYLFVVDFEQNGVLSSFDLSGTGAVNYQTPSVTYPADFNPLENRFLYAQFVLNDPSELTSYIPPWTGFANFPIRTIYLREPFKSGHVVVVWDGTDDEGTVAPPGDYLQAILAWKLPENAVIVASRPVISDWRTEPVYFVPGPNPYQSATGEYAMTSVQFTLSKDADVEGVIYDQSNLEVARINRPGASAGQVVLPWDGRRDSGELAAPGLYHMRLVATAPPGLESPVVNAIIKVVY